VIPIDPIIPHAVAPLGQILPVEQIPIPAAHVTTLPCVQPTPFDSSVSEAIVMLAVVGLGLVVWLIVQMIREWRA
jgi:hypothetical protein